MCGRHTSNHGIRWPLCRSSEFHSKPTGFRSITWIQDSDTPGCLSYRREDPLYFRMIATDIAREAEDDGSVERDNQDATLLKCITLHALVLVACEECAEIAPNSARMDEGGYAAPEARQIIRPPGRVDIHLNVKDPQILLEGPGKGRPSGADHDEVAACFADLPDVWPQLGHLLPA